MDKNKKYVLITGASSGIGRRIAIGLSETYNVVLHGRNLERLEETKNRCSTLCERVIFIKDLKETFDLEEHLSHFIKEYNIEISCFVHCAGYMKLVPLKMLTNEAISLTLNTN